MDKYNDIQQQAIEERIDAFVRGAMTEAEEQAFKQEIKADPELRAQVLAIHDKKHPFTRGSQRKDAYQQQHQRENAHARCMGMLYCCNHCYLLRLSERQAV